MKLKKIGAKLKTFHYNFLPENRKAWIRIFEAVIAVLLITSVLLIVIGQGMVKEDRESLKIYEKEISILREIQLNDTFRKEILDLEELPVLWNDFESKGLGEIKNKIILRTPDYLNCKSSICEMLEECILGEDLKEEVYVQSVAVTASLEKYSPRQIKLFCWKKGTSGSGISEGDSECTPSCSGKECGSDGCGGSCESCTVGNCIDGMCIRDLSSYLVLYLPLNESSPKDYSPYHFSISNHGATYTSEGKVDGAYIFYDDYMSSVDSPMFSGGTEVNLTVSAWINTNSITGTLKNPNPIISKDFSNKKDKDWGLGITNSKLFFGAEYNNNNWDENGGLQSSTNLTTGKWHHVAFTQNSRKIKIYLNGNLENETILTFDTPDTEASLDIGQNIKTYFNGKIDEIRIYNTPLSKGEINYLINNDGGI